jgi:polar amino acid transport system permease protein
MSFSFGLILRSLPLLLQAAVTTVLVSLLAVAIGFCIGTLVCLCRLSRAAAPRRFGALYVSFFRGVPLLVQLLLIYYLLPHAGINVPSIVAAVGSLALCTAAYIAEILRGGFLGLPRGQSESAVMLGLSRWQTSTHILVPQAVRLTLPALVNETIMLLKSSSLISVVGVAELTRTSQNIANSTYRPLEIYLAAGAVYLAINGCLALAGRLLERHLARAPLK